MHSGKQQPGRGKFGLAGLESLPTLDVRQLTDKQLQAADAVFADLKSYRMLPYNECHRDAWRHVLDARLLADVLGITEPAIHEAMQTLREMLSAEPSIRGTKKSTCNLADEREKHHLPGTDEDDSRALADEQQQLAARGIPLPVIKAAPVQAEKAKTAEPSLPPNVVPFTPTRTHL